MAIHIQAEDPTALAGAIRQAIDAGEFAGWALVDRDTLTRSDGRWARQAHVKLHVGDGRLVLGVVAPSNRVIGRDVFAHYQAQLVEALVGRPLDAVQSATASIHPQGRHDRLATPG
jgi:hypothetical protein